MFSVLGSAFYWIIQEEKAWSNNNIIARYRFILKDGNISFCARTATLKPWLAWNTISFVYFIFFPSYFLVAVVVVVTVDLWHTINMCYVSHLYLSKFSWFWTSSACALPKLSNDRFRQNFMKLQWKIAAIVKFNEPLNSQNSSAWVFVLSN